MSKEEGMTVEQFLKEQHDKLPVGTTVTLNGVTFTILAADDPRATPPKNARY